MSNFEEKYGKVLTIPNILSFLRILLIPVFVVFFLQHHYLSSAVALVISALTDLFDGLIARKLNQITQLGKLLDPLADKLTLLAVIICIGILVPWVITFVILLAVKDILMIIGGSVLIKRNILPPAAKWYGKVGTFIFYISVTVISVLKIMNMEDYTLVWILLSITVIAMIFALINYFLIFLKLMNESKKKKSVQKQQNRIRE
ncbi:MAG: CDP-alcohol phosphatidyltransferase family protein [Bacillota bacterium]|nr:CDP-alcohol phosphatidyltransferase family protein [Bacillota bacterium]